ncbi:MAG: hypothetical protein E7559_02410 [Ruminococcaceae bacterium]|nr:hypothetical protein [Oscillospiraceae bacterium]
MIEAIERDYLDEPVAVYNYVISDFHTYHVGESGVLVHNGLPPCLQSAIGESGSNTVNPNALNIMEMEHEPVMKD